MGCSSWFCLMRASSFCLFLKVTLFNGKITAVMKTELILLKNQLGKAGWNSHRRKSKKKYRLISSAQKILSSFFNFSYLYLFLDGKKFFRGQVKVKIGNSTFMITQQSWNATSSGKETLFHPFFSLIGRVPSIIRRKWTDLLRQNWTSKCLFPHRHHIHNLNSILPKLESWISPIKVFKKMEKRVRI